MELLKNIRCSLKRAVGLAHSRMVSRGPVSRKRVVSGQSLVLVMALCALLFGSALPSFAINAPAAGSLFFDVYDIVVNSMLKGAVGFVAAILVFMMGIGLFFVQKIIPGIIGVVCAALVIKADAIVTSLGLIF